MNYAVSDTERGLPAATAVTLIFAQEIERALRSFVEQGRVVTTGTRRPRP